MTITTIIAAVAILILTAFALAIVAVGRRGRGGATAAELGASEEPTVRPSEDTEASGGPTMLLVAQSGREDDPADDVIAPGHPLYPMMMEALRGNIVSSEQDDDGNVTITSSRPLR